MLADVHNFLKGINRFYTLFERRPILNSIIWQKGSTRVIDFSKNIDTSLPILFFIPSLINKSYILNLTEEVSMVNHFANLGYRVYLVDFTEPLDDELNLSFMDYQQRIAKALKYLCKNDPIVTIGYCLGGVFSCALHTTQKSNFIGQVLLATPWDFSHFKNIFSLYNPIIIENFITIVKGLDKVSPSLVQWFFSSIDPYKIWDKFVQFSKNQQQENIDKFLAIEQWVNDGISLSRTFALEALSMLDKNDLKNGKFFSKSCNSPCLIFSGLDDKIVPPQSSIKHCNLLTNKQEIIKKTGHIGLVASQLAKQEIWPEIEIFIDNLN